MSDPYGAIKFGEFRKYMQNKQAKLKDQERTIEQTATQPGQPQIFQGLSIYINGYTNPSQSELRRLIILHGGDYQHYLSKSKVTHIVASNLTQSKVKEFRAYKVVTPSWITESIAAQQLMPWPKYRLVGQESAQKQLSFQPQGKDLNAALLANPWNKENTSAHPGFIEKYYESSRLHHLSTWRAELKDMVGKMEQKYALGKRKRSSDMRIVMHIDFDCFFASVGLLDRPDLSDKPVAVSHGQGRQENSSSDIASCNYIARSYGIYNGMHVGAAKKKCPELQVIPYEFEKYKAISEAFYEILFGYAEQLQPVSVDEALIEVNVQDGDPLQLAMEIRKTIRDKTRCEASIGVGPNILLARLATKKAKPAGQHFCRQDQAAEFLQHLDVSDLPGVGYRMASKIQDDFGISEVGELAKISLGRLQHSLGPKTGKMLHSFARGIDNRELQMFQPRQSVSADVNWGVRFENEEQVKTFVEELAEEVGRRLRNIGQRGRSITIKILRRSAAAGEAEKRLGCGECDSFSKSVALDRFTDDPSVIGRHAYQMLSSFGFDPADLRGIGIQLQKLDIREEGIQQNTLRFAPAKESTTSPASEQQQQYSAQTSSSTASPVQHSIPPTTDSKPTSARSSLPSSSEAITASLQSEKPGINVDPAVFAELPKSVQEDLYRTHQIVFLDGIPDESPPAEATSAPTASAEPSIFISQPDLPPWSQLDPEVLLALPEAARKQVLQIYSKTRNQKAADKDTAGGDCSSTSTKIQLPAPPPPASDLPILISPHRDQQGYSPRRSMAAGSPRNSRQRTPRRSKKGTTSPGGKERTLTQMFMPGGTSPSRQASPSVEADRGNNMDDLRDEDRPPWDVNIWNELPPDIKQEILLNYRREKRMQERQVLDEQFRDAHDKLMYSVEAPSLRVTIPKEPELMGMHSLEDVRGLLRGWVSTYPDSPETEDVERVTRYLIELVHTKYLDKVQIIIVYLDHLIAGSDAWRPYVDAIQQQVSSAVQNSYGCPMRFN